MTSLRRRPLCVLALLTALLSGPCHGLDTRRDEVRRFIDDVVARNGLDRAWVTGLMAAAQTQQQVSDLMNRPAERVKPWYEYRNHFLTEQRIAEGTDFWVAHRERLEAAERDTGVAAHVIVGIIGVETFYGRITGRFRVLDALATLAFDYPPRAKYFTGELEQFLLLAREQAIDPLTAVGSYAGAMGAPQFMPRSYRAYAVDGSGDGRRDLWKDWDDVIASVANYLAKNGWSAGEPVAAPAELWYPDAEGLVAGSLNADSTVGALRNLGLGFDTTLPDDAPALLIGVRDDAGPRYLAGFRNFSAITRYNRSALYALAVHELGSRIEARLPAEAAR
jgi:membrane-bound lytic murein transglycosylase B